MKVILDAMGGDDAPVSPVAGAVLAARTYPDLTIVLVGQEAAVRAELAKHDTTGLTSRLSVVNATQVVEMHEHPAQAVRSKKDSSVVVGVNLLRKGEGDAFVSAGHSGATFAAASLGGRIKGVERAAMATVFPAKTGPILLLDVGANTEVKPEYLVQFAQMGAIYAAKVLKKNNPRVGLLSNGEEENKGTPTIEAAHKLLKQAEGINFKGNVEGNIVPSGDFDVVVSDGFTGNILLKTAEGIASMVQKIIKEELTSNIFSKILAAGLQPAFGKVRKRIDYQQFGGAPVLGVDHVVIITHGKMKAEGIKNALRVAIETYQSGTVEAITALYAKNKPAPVEAEPESVS